SPFNAFICTRFSAKNTRPLNPYTIKLTLNSAKKCSIQEAINSPFWMCDRLIKFDSLEASFFAPVWERISAFDLVVHLFALKGLALLTLRIATSSFPWSCRVVANLNNQLAKVLSL
ncbi:hypothetical protein, partial [Nostoc sp. T09]|uniref:hypothetical protein n=1 Tax=Nostoc sp. T09 TaxID=1932621 RepID=UPI001C4FFEE1